MTERKRVPVRLADDEINILIASLDAYCGDIAASGADFDDPDGWPHEASPDALRAKLMRARGRVREQKP